MSAAEPLIADADIAVDPADAAPAESLTAEPLAIDYAGRVTAADPLRRDAARAFVPLAVLSGLCVAAAWGAIISENALGFVHVLVFGATIVQALVVGKRLHAAGATIRARSALDVATLLGLLVVGLAPIGYEAVNDPTAAAAFWVLAAYPLTERSAPAILGVAYLAMGLTSCRHAWQCAELARWADDLYRRRLGRSLRALGWTKAIYETVWLGLCCGATLLAVAVEIDGDSLVVLALGALFGCVGYGAIWIWMIAAHATLARAHAPPGMR